jgi:hypothetical protein
MGKRDSISIREWEEFLATARHAGATDVTMVEDEVYELDPDILIGFKIDLDHDDASAAPKRVAVPTDILHDLLYVARTVADGDGDVRGLEPAAKKALADFNEHFLTPVLGPDPWAAAAREMAEEDADRQPV